MHLRIFTLPFDPVSEGFPDEVVTEFCKNKKVLSLEPQFFRQEERAFWSVSVRYEILSKHDAPTRELDEDQKLLYEKLREWRKETAQRDGVPVYLLGNNQQLIEIIRRKATTLEALKGVGGFGRSKIERYGGQVVAIVKTFFEKQKPAAAPAAAAEKMPF